MGAAAIVLAGAAPAAIGRVVRPGSPPRTSGFAGHLTRATVPVPTPSGCMANGPSSFVALASQNDFAGKNTGVGNGGNSYGLAEVVGGNSNEACDDFAGIAGGLQNKIGGDDYSSASFIGAGSTNYIERSGYSFIGSGSGNTVSSTPPWRESGSSAIVGGEDNVVSAPQSTVVGGFDNSITPTSTATPAMGLGTSAFIGGGAGNAEGSNFASIVGGYANSIGSTTGLAGDYGFIGGGLSNSLTGEYGALAGGDSNRVSGGRGFVGGGYGNTASGEYAAIAGGDDNTAAGAASFAGGHLAHADNDGVFAWADEASNAAELKSSSDNQFLVRASGGVIFYSNAGQTDGVQLCPNAKSWTAAGTSCAATEVVRAAALEQRVSTLEAEVRQQSAEIAALLAARGR